MRPRRPRRSGRRPRHAVRPRAWTALPLASPGGARPAARPAGPRPGPAGRRPRPTSGPRPTAPDPPLHGSGGSGGRPRPRPVRGDHLDAGRGRGRGGARARRKRPSLDADARAVGRLAREVERLRAAAAARPDTAAAASVLFPDAAADDADRNPVSAGRRAAARAAWGWHAARFEYEARDPIGPANPDPGPAFAVAAAGRVGSPGQRWPLTPGRRTGCKQNAPTNSAPPAGRPPARRPPRRGRRPDPGGGPVPFPDPGWVATPSEQAIRLQPFVDSPVPAPVEAGPRPYLAPTAAGVLVEATAGNRTHAPPRPARPVRLSNRLDPPGRRRHGVPGPRPVGPAAPPARGCRKR
jgi:hypothetical protein